VSTGLWIVIVAVVVAVGFGGYRALTDGRFRGTHRVRDAQGDAGSESSGAPVEESVWSDVAAAVPDVQPGERATLVQFSSAFCAPCRATRRILGDVAATVPGVVHVEIDAEHHLDLVRRVGVLRTPTTLVLGPTGQEVTRAAGAPTREQVLGALDRLLA
jgi:thiol-disulfide isomerase/thioredoxin